MADRPIIFSAPTVRALLDGRKTQTRRVLNLPTRTHSGDPIYERPDMGGWVASTIGGKGCYLDAARTIQAPERPCVWHQTCGTVICPPIMVGDRLYVREAHKLIDRHCDYRADWPDATQHLFSWRPSIHMPRYASRLTLTVTDVRVQRLQDISEADAVAEGCRGHVSRDGDDGVSPQEEYRALWNSLHGPGAWEANPWVAAYTFTVARGNIDQLGAR